MSAFGDVSQKLLPISLLKKDNVLKESDNDSARNSDEEKVEKEKTENGTQTKISRYKEKSSTVSLHKQQGNKYLRRIIIPNTRPKRRKMKLMDWKKYHRLSVIYAYIDELEKDYPAICTVTVIGKSVEGRDIKMLKISNSDASNKAVWLDGSIHSREWISAAVVTYVANHIVKNIQKLPSAIVNKDWHIVPVLNPDGYEYTHLHNRMWRKNRARYGGECVGVDLNRNFSQGWGTNGDQGSSEDPKNVFYRGPAPFSEPETAAVRDLILGSATPFQVFLSFHSYFELIIFPWGYKKEPCVDYFNLLEAGTAMSRAIFETTGMTYKVGSTKDLTYTACGTSIDWGYGVAKIPYCYMIELRGKKHRFRLPKDQIMETGLEIWNGLKSLMKYVDAHDNAFEMNSSVVYKPV